MKFRNCAAWVAAALLSGAGVSWVVRADDASKAKEPRPISYARAYLALARLDLQMALDKNKAFPNTLPRSFILLLEQQAAVAEEGLRYVESRAAKPQELAVKIAAIYAETTAATYHRAVQINRASGMSPQTLESLRLKAELAQMSLSWAKEIDPASPIALLQFQVERLRASVAELTRNQMELLERN